MRDFTRDFSTIIFILFTSPLWGAVHISKVAKCDVPVFVTCGQLLSLLPGLIGIFARRAFYLMTLDDCARDVGVGFGTWFSKRKVRIASQVSIGAHCLLGSCTIGPGTLLGSNIDVLSGRHQHGTSNTPGAVAEREITLAQINIGSNVWIGNRAIIMADVGTGSIVGAGSVVVSTVPVQTLVVGNPAVVKRIAEDSGKPSSSIDL